MLIITFPRKSKHQQRAYAITAGALMASSPRHLEALRQENAGPSLGWSLAMLVFPVRERLLAGERVDLGHGMTAEFV